MEESSSRNMPTSTNMPNKVSGNLTRGYKRSNDSLDSNVSVSVISQHLAYLGDGSNAIPNFPDILLSNSLPDECAYEDLDTLKYVFSIQYLNRSFSIRQIFQINL